MRDKDGFIIKCKYSDWQIVDAQDNHDDVCLYYPYYHSLKCYADERCAHYVPDIAESEEDPKPIKCDECRNKRTSFCGNCKKYDEFEQEPTVTSTDEPMTMVYPTIVCDDAISRKKAICVISACDGKSAQIEALEQLPSVTQKSGKCKNCKYFEYDSVAKVDGIPLIVAHEICNKWGDGCKTSEDGYCYLFEPQESEEQTE